jgi:hypothetical protein
LAHQKYVQAPCGIGEVELTRIATYDAGRDGAFQIPRSCVSRTCCSILTSGSESQLRQLSIIAEQYDFAISLPLLDDDASTYDVYEESESNAYDRFVPSS